MNRKREKTSCVLSHIGKEILEIRDLGFGEMLTNYFVFLV